MSYKVLYKGLEVVVETLDEVDALAARQAKAAPATLELRLNGNHKSEALQTVTLKGLISNLNPNAKKALKAIAKAGGRINDSDLGKAIHAKNNMALAGKLSPLYRAARDAKENGLAPFFQKELATNEGGQQVTEYCIPPDTLNEVKTELKV